jgi:hypothetical protein
MSTQVDGLKNALWARRWATFRELLAFALPALVVAVGAYSRAQPFTAQSAIARVFASIIIGVAIYCFAILSLFMWQAIVAAIAGKPGVGPRVSKPLFEDKSLIAGPAIVVVLAWGAGWDLYVDAEKGRDLHRCVAQLAQRHGNDPGYGHVPRALMRVCLEKYEPVAGRDSAD